MFHFLVVMLLGWIFGYEVAFWCNLGFSILTLDDDGIPVGLISWIMLLWIFT